MIHIVMRAAVDNISAHVIGRENSSHQCVFGFLKSQGGEERMGMMGMGGTTCRVI
jgi:hypothetical protein